MNATPALRAYALWRGVALDTEDAAASQARVLGRLLRTARMTAFGRAHGFAGIRGVRAYQRAVPLTDYERMWPEWWAPTFPRLLGATWPGKVARFALSSGTSSGRTKYIPVTHAMMRANSRAALDVLTHHLRQNPRSRILSGPSLVLGGSSDLRRLGSGVYGGDLSGIAADAAPLWARPFALPPKEIALLGDWDRKLDAIVRLLPGRRVTSLSGTPSWLLLLLARIGGTAPEKFPGLEMVVHGGVSFTPYRARFADWLRGSPAETREVFPASEGFFACADRGPDDGLRLITDGGAFFEFVPVAELDATTPARLTLREVALDTDYAMAVSTCAGLWAYLVGDIVRFVSLSPPRVIVVGRTSEMLSAFGEHVTGAEFFSAILRAAKQTGSEVLEATVGSEIAGHEGRHVVIIEGTPASAFAETFDRALASANEDYEAHRRGGQLLAPRIVPVRAGAFAAWMRAEGRLGGQNKLPRVLSDERLARLLEFLRANPDLMDIRNGA